MLQPVRHISVYHIQLTPEEFSKIFDRCSTEPIMPQLRKTKADNLEFDSVDNCFYYSVYEDDNTPDNHAQIVNILKTYIDKLSQ